jgi:P-type conjugative transfer protein TrbJ
VRRPGKDDHRLIDAVLTKHGRGISARLVRGAWRGWAADLLRDGGAMMEKLFRIRTKYFRSGCVVAVGTALAFLVPVVPAYAQWAVYDGANHVQNVLIAARALQQIDNQITSLANQADAGQSGRNLASLPLSTLSTLQSTISQTTALLAQAQNMPTASSRSSSSISRYTSVSSGMSDNALFAAQTRWQNSVAGSRMR